MMEEKRSEEEGKVDPAKPVPEYPLDADHE